MPPAPFTPQKASNGSFVSDGLNSKQFNQLFNRIEQAQKQNRRNAKRTLKPNVFTNPSAKALAELGNKVSGSGFTKQDLINFDKSRQAHKQKFDHKTAGVTYAFLVKHSRQIDVKRANNHVSDGSGITKANLYGIKNNIALVNVQASDISKHQHHRVKFRFEQWDELLQAPPNGDYIKAAKLACAGRISFDCDCGRHQYWYRYLATMGNYCLAPPKEFSFPKIRNPELSGVACKHVLKSITMLQSIAWQRILAKQMEIQAKRTGYGDDNRTHFLTAQEKKAAAKNKKAITDQDSATKAHEKYQRAQAALQRKLQQQEKAVDKVKRQARKISEQNKQIKELGAMLKMSYQVFRDGYKLQGKSEHDAITDFAKNMNVSPSKLQELIK